MMDDQITEQVVRLALVSVNPATWTREFTQPISHLIDQLCSGFFVL